MIVQMRELANWSGRFRRAILRGAAWCAMWSIFPMSLSELPALGDEKVASGAPPSTANTRVVALDGQNKILRFTANLPPGYIETLQLRWLSSKEVREELDVVEDQLRRISQIADEMAAYRSEIFKIGAKQEAKENVAEFNQQIASLNKQIEECRKGLSEVLLPFQRQRLEQLQERQTLYELGLIGALMGPLAKRLEIAESELEKQLTALQEVRDKLTAQRVKEQEAYFSELRALLTADQQSLMKNIVGNCVDFLPPSVEIEHWQLTRELNDVKPMASPVEEWLASPDTFQPKLGGGVDAFSFPLGMRFSRLLMVLSDKRYGRAELVSFQRADVVNPSPEELSRVKLLQNAMMAAQKRLIEGELSYDDYLLEVAKQSDNLDKWKATSFVGRLLPEQQDEVDRIILRRLISLRGLHACLVNGVLGTRLKITDAQRDEIKRVAQKRAERLNELSRARESEVWTHLRKGLGEDQRRALSEVIGPDIERSRGSPDLLLSSD